MFSEKQFESLFQALGCCLLVQRTYGKQASDLKRTAKVFESVLCEYDPGLVIKAVKEWIKREREFPTPADIVKITEAKTKLKQSMEKTYTSQEIKQHTNTRENPEFRSLVGLPPLRSV